MCVESQDYKLEVLEYAINRCINGLLPNSSEDALSVILYQSNEVVWRVATEIYTNSGYQVDFVFIRDIIRFRVEPLRRKIVEEKRIRAELEAQRLAKELERAKIIAEQERIRKEKEAEKEIIKKEKEAKQQKELNEFKKANPNIEINTYKEFDIFIKTRNLVIDILDVEEEQVTFEASFTIDLGADDLEPVEIIMALEEEFDIEIPDEVAEQIDTVGKAVKHITTHTC